jgi:protoporphyrinogen IX oxidase
MERRLLKAIMAPALVASWLLGGALIAVSGGAALGNDVSMWVKLVLALVLTGVHIVLAVHARAFARDKNTWSQRYFRFLNEVPTVLMAAIVILVIVRPL